MSQSPLPCPLLKIAAHTTTPGWAIPDPARPRLAGPRAALPYRLPLGRTDGIYHVELQLEDQLGASNVKLGAETQ